MFWPVALLILLVALLVPLTAVVLYSPVLRRKIDSPQRRTEALLEDLTKRVMALEDDVDDLGRAVEGLRDEAQFLQRLLEDPARREPSDPSAPQTS